MSFFRLNSQRTHDKIVNKEERIYADSMVLDQVDSTFSVSTFSFSPKLRIKFFLDAIKRYNIADDETFYFRIGKYVELEDKESIQLFNSSGFYNVTYNCSDNDGDGNFTCELIIGEINGVELTLYISAVSLVDSFCNEDYGWMNPDNPDNILDLIEDEINPGLPPGAEDDDILVFDPITHNPKWKPPDEVADTFPFATDTQKGVVLIDDDIVTITNGFLSVKDATETQKGVVTVDNITIKENSGNLFAVVGSDQNFGIFKVDNDTIVSTNGVISAPGLIGGILNYSEIEQDTGRKWIDGKNIYQLTIVDPSDGDVLVTGVETLVDTNGFTTNAGKISPIPQNVATVYKVFPELDPLSSDLKMVLENFVTPTTITVWYTKI